MSDTNILNFVIESRKKYQVGRLFTNQVVPVNEIWLIERIGLTDKNTSRKIYSAGEKIIESDFLKTNQYEIWRFATHRNILPVTIDFNRKVRLPNSIDTEELKVIVSLSISVGMAKLADGRSNKIINKYMDWFDPTRNTVVPNYYDQIIQRLKSAIENIVKDIPYTLLQPSVVAYELQIETGLAIEENRKARYLQLLDDYGLQIHGIEVSNIMAPNPKYGNNELIAEGFLSLPLETSPLLRYSKGRLTLDLPPYHIGIVETPTQAPKIIKSNQPELNLSFHEIHGSYLGVTNLDYKFFSCSAKVRIDRLLAGAKRVNHDLQVKLTIPYSVDTSKVMRLDSLSSLKKINLLIQNAIQLQLQTWAKIVPASGLTNRTAIQIECNKAISTLINQGLPVHLRDVVIDDAELIPPFKKLDLGNDILTRAVMSDLADEDGKYIKIPSGFACVVIGNDGIKTVIKDGELSSSKCKELLDIGDINDLFSKEITLVSTKSRNFHLEFPLTIQFLVDAHQLNESADFKVDATYEPVLEELHLVQINQDSVEEQIKQHITGLIAKTTNTVHQAIDVEKVRKSVVDALANNPFKSNGFRTTRLTLSDFKPPQSASKLIQARIDAEAETIKKLGIVLSPAEREKLNYDLMKQAMDLGKAIQQFPDQLLTRFPNLAASQLALSSGEGVIDISPTMLGASRDPHAWILGRALEAAKKHVNPWRISLLHFPPEAPDISRRLEIRKTIETNIKTIFVFEDLEWFPEEPLCLRKAVKRIDGIESQIAKDDLIRLKKVLGQTTTDYEQYEDNDDMTPQEWKWHQHLLSICTEIDKIV